jgi:hypothetical protein
LVQGNPTSVGGVNAAEIIFDESQNQYEIASVPTSQFCSLSQNADTQTLFESPDSANDCLPTLEIDYAVMIHMKAVHKAALARREQPSEQA